MHADSGLGHLSEALLIRYVCCEVILCVSILYTVVWSLWFRGAADGKLENTHSWESNSLYSVWYLNTNVIPSHPHGNIQPE